MISRIDRVKGSRSGALDGFSWPSGLDDFLRFNLIYGANGSGKTSLSRAFRQAGTAEPDSEFEVRLKDEGASKPIAVFNRDFVHENVLGPQGARHIVVIGEERVKEQKQLETLEAQIQQSDERLSTSKKKRDDNAAKLDKFNRDEAKKIKTDLIKAGIPAAGYDKADLSRDCKALAKEAAAETYDLEDIKRRCKESAKAKIEPLPIQSLDLETLSSEVEDLIQTSVLKTAAVDLGGPALSRWLETGLELHESETTCKFCTESIPVGRLEQLESAFDATFKKLVIALDTKRGEMQSARRTLAGLSLPSESEFYEDLKPGYRGARERFDQARSQGVRALDALISRIDAKRSDMFGEMAALGEVEQPVLPLDDIDSLVTENNEMAASIDDRVKNAQVELTNAYVQQRVERFKELEAMAESTQTAYLDDEAQLRKLEGQAKKLRDDLAEPGVAADRINTALAEFLGHESIRLRPGETGYAIERGGEAADVTTLSEGETTALALIHFLQSLEHDGQRLEDLVVVIDDPISSLDASALFHAFGFIRSNTKSAHQLFLLTHNLEFFRLVRSWMINKNEWNKTRARFYMTMCGGAVDARKVQLLELDPVLVVYESEYHFLFGQLVDAQDDQGFEFFYTFPNTARRVLETFLSFKNPGSAVAAGGTTLHDAIQEYDAEHAAEISKYLHAHSHEKSVTVGSGHDISNIEEAPTIAKRVLNFMDDVDPRHTQGMTDAIDAARKKVAKSPA